MRLAPGDSQLTSCPTPYWEERGAAFVIAKVTQGNYGTMFYFPGDPGDEQYGTGRPEYDDLVDCVMAVLRAQADHEKERHGVASGKTARDLQGIGELESDYAGPGGPEA